MDYPITVLSVGLVNGRFADEDPRQANRVHWILAAWGNSVLKKF